MADWPSIAAPSNIRDINQKGQIRSDFDAGYVQSRAKWTRTRRKFELSWNAMSNTDKETLMTFFENNLGDTFAWIHPLSGTSYTVRFTEENIEAKYIPYNRWQVSLILEEQ